MTNSFLAGDILRLPCRQYYIADRVEFHHVELCIVGLPTKHYLVESPYVKYELTINIGTVVERGVPTMC